MRQNSVFVRALLVCLFSVLFAGFAFSQQGGQVTEGSLRAVDKAGDDLGLCPLKNTFVRAEISGFMTRVTVTQTFSNPFPEPVEAVYTFPLPNDAAVDEMTITVGERVIKGRIMERKQAQEVYEKAKQEGKVAALLAQQRPNIFTQSVANITPGAEIKVVISYVETLRYADDGYEFRFPMTVGERYIDSQTDAEEAARISPPSKERPSHTISLEVEIDAGVSIENLASASHEITAQQFSASKFLVKLKNEAEIPNRDFVLKYKTAGSGIEDAILAHKDENGGFFTLILQPPDKVLLQDTTPKEIIFVLDTSGSMMGYPIEKAKEAMRLTLDNLNPQDTFNLITFAGEARILFPAPVRATAANLAVARKMLGDVESEGATEMMKAIKAALDPSDSQQHIRIVCFMTDGYVSNEQEIIAEVRRHPNARIFAFGIGNPVNTYLLDEIAREGRGEVEYVSLYNGGSVAARRFFERIRNPLLTDVSLEFQGVQPTEIFPQEIPDLFDAKPVTVVGKYAEGGSGKVVLRGKMRGQTFAREIAVEFPEQNSPRNDALATLWARRKIADLTRQTLPNAPKDEQKTVEATSEITNLGLAFRLLTPFTSFVAFDEQMVTDGSQTTRIEVPVATGGETLKVDATSSSQIAQMSVSSTTAGSTVTITETDNGMDTSATAATVTTVEPLTYLERGKSLQSVFSVAGGVTQGFENRNRFAQDSSISITGQCPTSNYFTLGNVSRNTGAAADETSISLNIGALPNLTASGGTNSVNAFDATREVAVRTMAAAKEGRVVGASFDFVAKKGTNAFHGSLFETFGSEAFNADDFFAKSRGLERAAARLNQFGGTFGGFLWKDMAFFFGSYEGLRLRQPSFSISEVPGEAARQNASGNLRALFDAFPLPNGQTNAGGFAEFSAAFTNPASHDIFSLQLDLRPSYKNEISVNYNLAASKAAFRGDRDFSLNTLRNFRARTDSLSLSANSALTNSVLIAGQVNFSRNRLNQNFTLDDFGGANVSPLIDAASAFDFLKYDLLGGKNSALAFGNPTATTINQFQANGSLEWIINGNLLSFGADFRRLKFDIGAQPIERSVLFAGANSGGNALRINELTRNQPPAAALGNFSLYAQDEWRGLSNFRLTMGLRWDMDFAPELASAATENINFQNATPQMRDNFKNFAPRVAFSFDPFNRGRMVFRGAAGLYFDFGNAAASEVFANSFPAASGNFARNVVWTAAPNVALKPLIVFDRKLETPRAWKFLAEYQHEIFAGNTLTINYMGALGRRLFLTRTFQNADPNYNFVRLTDNDAESNFHAANVIYEKRLSSNFSFAARYTFAKSIDNYSPDDFRRNVFVSPNLKDERAASDSDVRHQFSIYGTYNIRTPFDGGALNLLTKNWTIFGFANARTAFPLNVTYARVGDFGVELFRPDLIAGAPFYTTSTDGRKQINAAAFSIPATERQGTLGRNALRGFPFFQMDFGLERSFRFSSESNLRLRMEIFNALNNTNFADMSGNLGTLAADANLLPNTFFGKTVSAYGSRNFTPFYLYGGARRIQFSARFVF